MSEVNDFQAEVDKLIKNMAYLLCHQYYPSMMCYVIEGNYHILKSRASAFDYESTAIYLEQLKLDTGPIRYLSLYERDLIATVTILRLLNHCEEMELPKIIQVISLFLDKSPQITAPKFHNFVPCLYNSQQFREAVDEVGGRRSFTKEELRKMGAIYVGERRETGGCLIL